MSNPIYAVVPAAGIGARMQADRPKQYLMLGEQTILQHTVSRLLHFSKFEHIVLPVASHDAYIQQQPVIQNEKVSICEGGAERFESVLNGLNHLLEMGANEADWVMVHDVARPCITQADLHSLYHARHQDGCILGMQVRDTMKRTDEQNKILTTVERDHLWHALTPQLAPLGLLKDCIDECIKNGKIITDEASALEFCGYHPTMVAGHPSNIKVTRPEDLIMAHAFIQEIK